MSAGRSKGGRVFVISSPSGGGKTTVVDRLCQSLPRLVRSVSATTRSPRSGERPGKDYQFVTVEAFTSVIRNKELLEWASVHEAYYGTPKAPVVSALKRGRDIILSIDVQGAQQIQRTLGRRAILIFLMPPSMEQLRKRLKQRKTDLPEAIRRRLATARREMACASWYDHIVINDELDHAVAQVRAIIEGTRSKQVKRGKV